MDRNKSGDGLSQSYAEIEGLQNEYLRQLDSLSKIFISLSVILVVALRVRDGGRGGDVVHFIHFPALSARKPSHAKAQSTQEKIVLSRKYPGAKRKV